MENRARTAALLLGGLLLVGFFTYVWPTAYRDVPVRAGVPITGFVRPLALREHRLSGRIDVLTSSGWRPLLRSSGVARLDSIARDTTP